MKTNGWNQLANCNRLKMPILCGAIASLDWLTGVRDGRRHPTRLKGISRLRARADLSITKPRRSPFKRVIRWKSNLWSTGVHSGFDTRNDYISIRSGPREESAQRLLFRPLGVLSDVVFFLICRVDLWGNWCSATG